MLADHNGVHQPLGDRFVAVYDGFGGGLAD